MKRSVVAGHVCLDIIPQVSRDFALRPGHLVEIGAAVLATGGTVSNTGIGMHLLGMPVSLMGKVGSDVFGRGILDIFRDYGSDLVDGMKVVEGEQTSYTVVINPPGSDRSFLHCAGANDTFSDADVRYDKLSGVQLFHFGYPQLMRGIYADDGRALSRMMARVKQLGVTTSMDCTMPDPGGPSGQVDWLGVLERTAPDIDIFLPSADELLYMIDREHFGAGDDLSPAHLSRLGDRLLEFGIGIAGIKLGSRGLYIRTAGAERLGQLGGATPPDLGNWAGRELWFPIFEPCEFRGATGAGDATIAGFLAGLLRELSIEATGNVANAVGALNVQAPDALGGLRNWEETLAYARQRPRGELDLDAKDWHFDSAHQVWRSNRDGTPSAFNRDG